MSIFSDTKLNVIIGAYGSGKSEISVNLALNIKKELPDQKVLLSDMDIVNPFYRSADAKKLLEDNGVKVIIPSYAGSNVDAPVLAGEMYIVFDDDSYKGIYDIGGEDMGATVLGSLHSRLMGIDHRLYMVVNTLRPFTETPEQIAEMANELAAAANMKINGFINNTNLLEESSLESVYEGEEILAKTSEITGIPLVATAIMEELLPGLDKTHINSSEIIKLQKTIFYNY